MSDMKNETSNPSRSWLAMLIIAGLVFLVQNWWTWLYCDDFTYAFCLGPQGVDFSRPITGIRDVLVSQYYHFLNTHGRILAIGLDQWFLGLREKHLFDVCNALVFTGYIWLMQKVSGRTGWSYTLLTIVVVYGCMRAFGQVFLWQTGCLNYLWGGFFNLAFLYVLRRHQDDDNLKHSALPCLLALAAGWWQESFSIGVLSALGVVLLWSWWKHKKVARVPLLMGIAYFAGTMVILCSPGNLGRTADEGIFGEYVITHWWRNIIHVLINVRVFWLLVAAAVVQQLRHKVVLKTFAHDNALLLLAMGIEMLFLMILGPIAEPRALFGMETFALVLLLRLMPDTCSWHVGAVLAVLTLAIYLPVMRMTWKNHQITQAYLQEVEASEGTIFFNLPHYSHRQRHYLGDLLVTDHRSQLFIQEAAYYGKPRLMVLPHQMRQELYTSSSFICPEHMTAEGEYTTPDIDFTVKPWPSGQPLPLNEEGCEYVSFPSGNYRLKNKPYLHSGLWTTKR